MPVTHGVASSSLVQTAERGKVLNLLSTLFFLPRLSKFFFLDKLSKKVGSWENGIEFEVGVVCGKMKKTSQILIKSFKFALYKERHNTIGVYGKSKGNT